MNETLQIYSDESGHPSEKIQSITCIVSTPNVCKKLERETTKLLTKNKQKEIKFSKIRTNKKQLSIAQKLLSLMTKFIDEHEIYIYNITQKHTKRTSPIPQMYDTLFEYIKEKHAKQNFNFYPDQNNALNRRSKSPQRQKKYRIQKIEEVASHEQPIVQYTDLLAGMSCFMVEYTKEFSARQQNKKKNPADIAKKHRFQLVQHFVQKLESVGQNPRTDQSSLTFL